MSKPVKRYKFWFEGRGGMRSESVIKEFLADYTEEEIEFELKDWVYSLRSNSEYKTYGWDEIK